MGVEAWGILVGVALTIGVPLGAWLMSAHGKLSRIDERTSMIVEQAQADRDEHKTIHKRIDGHEKRIVVLEHK